MFKKLAFLILIVFLPLVISAEELSESESFLAAKAKYDEGYYSVAADLFNNFISNFTRSPAIFEARLYMAQCFFRDNKFIAARDILNNLEKTYVPFAIEDRFLFLSAQIYLRANDFREASKYFRKLIDKHPDSVLSVDSKMQLGWALFQDGKYQEAEKVYDSLTMSEDLSIQEEALFKRGEALFFAKDYVKSLESYDVFLKLFPNFDTLARVYFYMAEANFYLEDFQNATEYYYKALKSAEDDDSIKVVSLEGIGWSYLKQNKLSQAEEAFLKIEKLQNSDFNRENFLFGMANLYYQLSKFDKSVVYYEELINKYPHTELLLDVLFGKAQCLTNIGRFNEAISLYDRVIERTEDGDSPKSKDLLYRSYYNLGYIYFTEKRLQDALDSLEKVTYRTTDEELKRSAFIYSADIYQELEEFDRAIEIYSKILNDYLDSPYNDYALYQLGISQFKTGDTEKAISTFKNFNENFNNSEFIDDVNYYLGYAYFNKDDFVSACRQLEKFLEAFYDSVYTDRAIYLLATSFYNRKMFQESIDNLEKILKNFKNDKSLTEKAEYAIIYALYEQGKETEAIKKIKQFIDKYPDSQLRRHLIFWLGQYYYNNSLYELSRRNFNVLIADYPKDEKLVGDAQYEVGLSYLAENKIDDALDIFKKLSDEANTVLLKVKSTLAMADLLSGQGRQEEAIKIYNKVASLASKGLILEEKNKTGIEIEDFLDYTEGEVQLPKSVIFDSAKDKGNDSAEHIVKITYIRLGDLYKEGKELNKAIYAYRQAINYAIDDSTAYLQFRVGECFEEKNDFDASIEEYLKIPYFSEQDKFWVVKGLLRCANIYEDRGNWQRAIAMYERVFAYDTPEIKYAQERIELIKSR